MGRREEKTDYGGKWRFEGVKELGKTEKLQGEGRTGGKLGDGEKGKA